MGYRIHEHKYHEPHRSTVDVATPIKIYIHNGTASTFAFPCWYQEVEPPVPALVHDRHWHDHIGWPSPTHPGHSCQLWIPEKHHCLYDHRECHLHCEHFIDYRRVIPIHLLSDYEDYSGADVAWVDEPEGISINAWIDTVSDWVVRVGVDCRDPNAVREPQHYKFTVFVNNEDAEDQQFRRDIVALAELVVLPSAYVTEDNNG